jgi:putative membrane protein
MMSYYGGYGVLGGFGMGVGMILWVVLIAVVVWAVVSLFARGNDRSGEMPLEILKRRYARGEISQAEFEQARAHLD